jgi:hypothetical protein
MGNPGLGVMIGMLGGNEATVDAVRSSLGKCIKSARLADGDSLVIDLTDGTTLRLQDNGQSCCESRYMSTDDDLDYYSGATLLDFEIASAPDVEETYETHEVQFLHVKTTKGAFTMQNHNEHNGYYGGFWIVASVTTPDVDQSAPCA